MKKHFALIISLVLGLGIASSVALAWILWRSDTDAALAQFHEEVGERAVLLDRQIALDLEVLYSLKALYDTSENVSRQEFSTVAIEILKRHPNVQALEWIPKVRHEERRAYETAARRDGYPDFQITQRAHQGQMVQAEVRSHYFPVYFVEPLVGNELAVGFDLASNTTRLKTLIESRDSGRLLATASITLVQEKGDQKGFLGFLPVYDGAPTSAAARTKLLKGFMLGVFRVGDIFQSAVFRENPGGIGHAAISLIDESADAGNPVLHRQSSADDSRLLHQFSYRKSLKNIAGRNWVIVATPTGAYISAQRSWQPLVALVVGLTFTALLSVYLRLISTRTAQVERLVERRTNELLEANTELVRLSRIDGLTGVANRRVFDEGFAKEWKRAFRDATPLSLLMIDVDGFKLFNDHYGHQAGDDCLKSIAGSLKTAARRPADVVARYGGEEFVIMLSSTDSDSAAEIAESIRARIEALAIPHEKSPLSDVVTVSIGVDTVTSVIGVTPHSLIERADQALYQAKNSGRNTVVTARAPAVEANGTSRELIGLRS